MPEVCQYHDGSRTLTFRRTDQECVALEAHYAGIRFNQVQLIFLPWSALQDDPERDEIDILFNVSGRGDDLVRHGFAVANWLAEMPASGVSHNRAAVERGHIWQIMRTPRGYRLQGARYPDSLTKLAILAPVLNGGTPGSGLIRALTPRRSGRSAP